MKPPVVKSPRRGSLRRQLIAWNVAALALLLAVLGVTVRWTVASYLMLSVNRELQKMTEHPAPGAPNGPPMGRPGEQPPDGPGRMPGGDPFGGGGDPGFGGGGDPTFDGGGDPAFGGEPGGRRPPRPRIIHDDDVFGPRHFDLQGRQMGSRTMLDLDGFTQAKAGKETREVITLNNEPVEVMSVPLRSRGRVVGVTQAAYPLTDVYRALEGVDTALLTLIPVGLLGAGVGGAFLTNRVLRRVRDTAQAAEQIGIGEKGGFSARLPVAGNDEFSELSQTFNGLLNRLETAYAQQTAALEQQRRFTADASHELKTPLTVIRGTASMALSLPLDNETARSSFQSIASASEMMSHLVGDLLLLARSDGGQMGKNRVEVLLREVLERAIGGTARKEPPVTLVVEEETLAVDANEMELVRLFSNLVDNATRHTPPPGAVTVRVARTIGGEALVRVVDTGTGIAPQHLSHLGDRFYRVDESRTRSDGGTGLGLSICRSIAEAHGGKITIESTLGVGTTVSVLLPAAG